MSMDNNVICKNKNGFTLMELTIAVALIGLISFALMEVMRQQNKIAAQAEQDTAFAQVNMEILNLFNNQSHCNANFYNISSTSDNIATAIYKCSDLNTGCHTAIPFSKNSRFPVMTTAWNKASTKITDNVRISSVTIKVTPPSTSVTSGESIIGTASTSVTFEFRSSFTNKTKSGAANANFTKTYNAPIVIRGGTTTVLGCPVAHNTPIAF